MSIAERTEEAGETAHRPPGRPARAVVLEVILISAGVFLGLLGDAWRERAQHREFAEASLRRFRTEITVNRKALLDVRDYHVSTLRALQRYLGSDLPKTEATFDVQFNGLGVVYFEQTAWDLALATQSLAYLDPDLAFALSRTYTVQRGYARQQEAILSAAIYGRSWNEDFEGYWQSLLAYYGDLSFLDPALLRAYDQALPLVDRALGEDASASPAGGDD
jgi:hypothetical protein